MPDLLPKLKKIKVDPIKQLYLDPNNPRFLSKEKDEVEKDDYLNEDIEKETQEKMSAYDIKQIGDSIKINGWQPVDSIFVRAFKEDHFVVLEGNRRVTAIKTILLAPDSSAEIKEQLREIEVMEVTDKINRRKPRESELAIRRKISYLLGVRHHGSLKQWSPFAQASSIYERYLSASGQSDATFKWDKGIAEKIAKELSMNKSLVRERICVFRVMKQIGEFKPVKESEDKNGDEKGGIKDSYYSLCKEVVMNSSESLRKFIAVGPDFLLKTNPLTKFGFEQNSLEMMVSLCNFDKKRKAKHEQPMNNPQQWRYLGEILADDNQSKRQKNLARVVNDRERPEDVWAEREAELTQAEWSKWLNEVFRLFDNLRIGQIEVNEESTEALRAVVEVLEELEMQNV